MQSEFLEGRRGKAGAEPLVAHQDDPAVVVSDLWDPIWALWIEPPLQDIAVDDDCARQRAIASALFIGTGVYDKCSRRERGRQLFGLNTVETRSSIGQKRINRLAPLPHLNNCAS